MNKKRILATVVLCLALPLAMADRMPASKQPIPAATEKLPSKPASSPRQMVFPLAQYDTPIVRAKAPVTDAEKLAAKSRPCPQPEYPHGAMKRGEQGVTKVRFMVEPDGFVSNVSIAVSSGSAQLDEASISTIGGCWFEPAKHGLSEWMETSYTWKL
ncbi:MAG TPA: energy transducer TonB [Telluria sp.]|nr:energy transducer TonB [Telluria sp.]